MYASATISAANNMCFRNLDRYECGCTVLNAAKPFTICFFAPSGPILRTCGGDELLSRVVRELEEPCEWCARGVEGGEGETG